MRRLDILILLATLVSLPALAGQPLADFHRLFEDATLRVDFHHSGDAANESISIDRLYRQGTWSGTLTSLVDPFPYGGYRVEAFVAESDSPVFTHGFDSYFGEYRTTGPAAQGVARSYHETVLLPFPKQPLHLVFEAHRRDGSVVELAEFTVDPDDVAISLEPPLPGVVVVEAHTAGDPHISLDIAILGEGYTASQESVFRADLARFTDVLLSAAPYSDYRASINVKGVLKPSPEAGCDEPTRGTYRATSLGATFNSLGSERYMLTEDNRALRDIAANVPYDALVIMVNQDRYGGGGIYRLYCTFTAHNQWSDYLLLHEFGHSFSALADEYYSSSVAYNDFYPKGREPVDPNITALLNPEELKWRDLVTEGTEIPTLWEKAEYDRMDGAYQKKRGELNESIAEAARTGEAPEKVAKLEQEAELLSKNAAEKATAFLEASAFAGEVGAFEGAGYSSEGLYRPMLDCLMFSKGSKPFCEVCRRSVSSMIKRYLR